MLSSCLQVRSPLSDAILGEQMLVVSEDKVAVTELRAAVVAGLALALHPEPGHPGVLTAVCRATATLRGSKQVRVCGWPGGGGGALCPGAIPVPLGVLAGGDAVRLAVLL